jgi:hypothetical protein
MRLSVRLILSVLVPLIRATDASSIVSYWIMAWALLMSFSFPDENLVVKKMNLFAVWAFPWNGWTVLLILSSSDGFHSIRWHRNILLQQSAIHEVHVCIRALLCAA